MFPDRGPGWSRAQRRLHWALAALVFAAAPVALLEGDAFLLCSDGWWDAFDLAGLAASLVRASGPEDWLALMQQAIEARALPRQDNFSAIAVWVRDPIESTRPATMR